MLKRDMPRSQTIEDELQQIHSLIWQVNSDYTTNAKKQIFLHDARTKYITLQNSVISGLDSYSFMPFNDFQETTKGMDTRIEFPYWINGESNNASPSIPHDTTASSYGTVGPVLATNRMKQADVIDILDETYKYEQIPLIQLGIAIPMPIKPIVQYIEKNIVALSDDLGVTFGTGLLIHCRLVLTARHCLESRTITDILVRNNYQKQRDKESVDFWTHNRISKIVEENAELDYAIILLRTQVENFHKITLNLKNTYFGSSIFLHHPMGGPKKVSIHESLESSNEMWSYSGFHDSEKGSSGGVYIDVNGKIFALHCLKISCTTNAKWIKDIYEVSYTLKTIYKPDGATKDSLFLSFDNPINQNLLPAEDRQSYGEYLETIDRQPSRDFLNANAGRSRMPELAHHHIIPKSNLEFLWMLGKEFPRIESLLKNLAWKHPQASHPSHGNLVVNNVIWSTWNLFTGPSSRPGGLVPGYDPKVDQFTKEPAKPFSFDLSLWNALTPLHIKITEVFDLRSQISGLEKTRIIELLDASAEQAIVVDPDDELATSTNPFKKYKILLNEVCGLLRPILSYYDRTTQLIHLTNNKDWTVHDRYVISTIKPVTSMKVKHLYLYYDEHKNCLLYSTITPQDISKSEIELKGPAFSNIEEKIKYSNQLTDQEKYEIISETSRRGDTILDSYKLRTSLDEPPATKVIVYLVSEIIFDNPILNHPMKQIVFETAYKIGGINAINYMIELGLDQKQYQSFLSNLHKFGITKTLSIELGYSAIEKGYLVSKIAGTPLHKEEFTQNHLAFNKQTIVSFVTKEAIEALPIIKYFFNEILYIPFVIPEVIDNNYFKIALYNVAVNIGMSSLTGKIDITSSSIPTAIYGSKILVYEYLANQKHINFQSQEDKSIDSPSEFIQKCGLDILAQTSLGIIGSLVYGSPIFYDSVISAGIGSIQCYSLHNQKEKNSGILSTIESIIPYTMNALVLYVLGKNMQFDLSTQFGQMLAVKQSFAVMSSVVMTDYLIKLSLPIIIERVDNTKERYIDPLFKDIEQKISHVIYDGYYYLIGVNEEDNAQMY